MTYQYNDDYYDASRYGYQPEKSIEIYHNDEKVLKTSKIVLLAILLIFLAGATTLGAVSIALHPWWVQSLDTGDKSFEVIKIGLWKSCLKINTSFENWTCNDYDSGEVYNSPYKYMKVIKWCMVAATGASFLGFVATLIGLIGRKNAILNVCKYFTVVLCLASAVLFGVCIGYSSDVKTLDVVAPTWIKENKVNDKVTYGLYFFLACSAGGAAFVAMVFGAVFVFISGEQKDDLIYHDEKMASYNEENINRGYHGEANHFEREISMRGRDVVRSHSNDYITDNSYRENPHQTYQQSNYNPGHYDNQQVKVIYPRELFNNHQGPVKNPKSHAIDYPTDSTSYDQRLENEYYGRKPYQSYQPVIIEAKKSINGSRRSVKTPNSQLSHGAPNQDYHQQQPRLVKVHQHPNSAPIQYQNASRQDKQRPSNNSEATSGYGEYEMYFNSPY